MILPIAKCRVQLNFFLCGSSMSGIVLSQLSAHNKESTFTELWIRYGLEALRYWTSSFRMWSYKVLKCLSGLEHYGYANALPDGSAEADRGDACPPSQLVADCRSQAVIDDWSNTVREKALDTLYDSIDANFPADEPPSQAEKDRLQQLRNWMRQSRGQQPPTFTLPSKDELLKRLRDYHTTAVASLGESCVARALAVAGQKADDAIAVQNGNDGTASGKSTPSTRQQQPPRKQSMRNSDASDAVRTKQRQGAYPPREDALKWTRERSATARKANGAVAMHHSERVEGVSRSRRKGPRRKEGDDTEEEEEDDEYSGQEGQEAAEAKRVAKAKAVASKDKRMIHDEDEEENDEDGDNDEQDVNGGEFEFSRSTPGGGISVAKSTGKGKKIGWYDGEAEEGIEATPKSSEKPHSTTKVRQLAHVILYRALLSSQCSMQ